MPLDNEGKNPRTSYQLPFPADALPEIAVPVGREQYDCQHTMVLNVC